MNLIAKIDFNKSIEKEMEICKELEEIINMFPILAKAYGYDLETIIKEDDSCSYAKHEDKDIISYRLTISDDAEKEPTNNLASVVEDYLD